MVVRAMTGRISGLGWTAGGYMNPDMPPEVARALAERGFAPDGTRLPTPVRLKGINDRISADWQQMGFNPPAPPQSPPSPEENIFEGANSPFADTGPDPFGQETRQGLEAMTAGIDADMGRTNALVDAILNAETAPPSFGDAGRGRPVTPFEAVEAPEAPAAAVAPPKPRMKPPATEYTIQAGDNPTTIAKRHGLTLKELEARNPGILKKARRLKIGAKVNV
jgi:hypothetical protein